MVADLENVIIKYNNEQDNAGRRMENRVNFHSLMTNVLITPALP